MKNSLAVHFIGLQVLRLVLSQLILRDINSCKTGNNHTM